MSEIKNLRDSEKECINCEEIRDGEITFKCDDCDHIFTIEEIRMILKIKVDHE